MKFEIVDTLDQKTVLKGLEKCPKLCKYNTNKKLRELKPYFTAEVKRSIGMIITLIFVYILMIIVSIVGHLEMVLSYVFELPVVLLLFALQPISCIKGFIRKYSIVDLMTKKEVRATIEAYEFGVRLYYYGNLVLDVSWGNIISVEIYDNLIFINCEIEKYSFFIKSDYEKKLCNLLESYEKNELVIDKRIEG